MPEAAATGLRTGETPGPRPGGEPQARRVRSAPLMKKPSLLVVFLTVFIDLIGFGIVLPLLPVYSHDFGASGFMVGTIIASFSLMQFVFAPLWGRWSDRLGRRPILLVSTAGAAGSYALFALGSSLEGSAALGVLLASRVFAGLCGANITVAQAYIADVTPPEDRSRKMGLIGMAFGLGFILGPALGAVSFKAFGLTGPGWVAAALCAANFLLALAILPESLKPSSEHLAGRPRLGQWAHTLRQPRVGALVALYFLATFCFTCFETTLGLLVSHSLHLNIKNDDHAKTVVGYLFAYGGVVGAVIQGGTIGRLVKLVGEPRLIAFSLVLTGLSLAPMPYVRGWPGLLALIGLLAVGSSLTRPPLFGLLSILTPAREQGAVIGVAQSAGSLARIPGPVFAATLFYHSTGLPYLVCGAIALLSGLWAWRALVAAPGPAGVPQTTDALGQ
jgi:multidrug resistance protein